PTYQNSQAVIDPVQEDMLSITPAVFSPDNDGYDDIATLSYHFPVQGYVCNITVYDAAGRAVKRLANNMLCGIRGQFRWDGLDDRGRALPIGVYVVYMEVFTTGGKNSHCKRVITLARNMR
ncbi:MAG: gliding motility-associated C-terminal domain-containing protein, partial [Bacteroidetes bacterium]|nr:gliding motility-associated C-terminal domain-containing protein [Bacteroidota bacterium]